MARGTRGAFGPSHWHGSAASARGAHRAGAADRGLAPQASTSCRPPWSRSPNPPDRHEQPEKRPGRRPSARDRRHGRARVAWPAGTRPRRLRPPAEHGLGSAADGARHFTNWATGALSLTRKASVRVDVFEETGERGLRGHKPGNRWRETLGFRVASQRTFPSWDGNCRLSPSASPCCPSLTERPRAAARSPTTTALSGGFTRPR